MLLFFPFTLLEKEKPMLEHGFARPSRVVKELELAFTTEETTQQSSTPVEPR
jgi:hypothetical protein